ncbi:unnamed protein product [Protopolystoma xenopodis]|uniref:Uncharacterized protein n=1 Tax=Protopolystoma xenopodis TaxID=117903 RepID=A0A3S5CHP9_9PLAT|nr:unnamed protein product [Protopolystoma xenopodis]
MWAAQCCVRTAGSTPIRGESGLLLRPAKTGLRPGVKPTKEESIGKVSRSSSPPYSACPPSIPIYAHFESTPKGQACASCLQAQRARYAMIKFPPGEQKQALLTLH